MNEQAEITEQVEDKLFRQLAVYGHEAQRRLMSMRVYIHGLSGVGIEVAKNLILAGPKSVTIFDEQIVKLSDLGSNFYLQEKHVQKCTRLEAALPLLKRLNENVIVTETHSVDIPYMYIEDIFRLANFDCVVVLDNFDKAFLKSLGDQCHNAQKGFIYGGNIGLYGFLFVDFGEKHTVFDDNGEPEQPIHIQGITNDEQGIVLVHEDSMHSLNDGDIVMFNEVQGMIEVNKKLFKVKVIGPKSFKISNTLTYGLYTGKGYATQVKMPLQLNFKNFSKSLAYPYAPGERQLPQINFQKFGIAEQLHEILNGIFLFYARRGCLPKSMNSDDAHFLEQCLMEYQKQKMVIEGEQFKPTVDVSLIQKVALSGNTQIAPSCSFWGGIITQQIIKMTGKYTPVKQWLHHETFEMMSTIPKQISNNRYHDYSILFGEQYINKILNAHVFVVGAGALGCQYIKMFCQMGVGKITCTDDDNIQMSNLNRQFLFRKQHIGQNKSKVACSIARSINHDVEIVSAEVRVSSENQDIFDDQFFKGLTFIVNAVDNVEARRYIDNQCVWHSKPLFESGTLGTKCHSQIIIPHLTQSYNDLRDPEEKKVPLCTLKNFPYQIEHTIQWARDYFEGVYVEPSGNLCKFYENKKECIDQLVSQNSLNQSELRKKLESILKLHKSYSIKTYEICVQLASELFQHAFNHQIESLIESFPLENIDTKTKKPFWSGLRRFPQPLSINVQDKLHLAFFEAAANIFANIFQVKIAPSSSLVETIKHTPIKPFIFKPVTIEPVETNSLPVNFNPDDEKQCQRLIKELLSLDVTNKPLPVHMCFEKDDSTNYHIQFVGAVSNLRARNYHIEEVDNFKVKLIAGKIIPAIATTTAAIVGVVGLEIVKYILGMSIEYFKDTTINLALPMFVFNDPAPPIMNKDMKYDPQIDGPLRVVPKQFTKWDKIELNGPITIDKLRKNLQKMYEVKVTMITYRQTILLCSYTNKSSMGALTIEEAIKKVTKKGLEKYRRAIPLAVALTKDGDTCVMPEIRYHL